MFSLSGILSSTFETITRHPSVPLPTTRAVYPLILSSRVAFDEPDGSVGENLFLKLIFLAKFLFREWQCEAFNGHLWPFSVSLSICACAMI
jgi:hypothetical protein